MQDSVAQDLSDGSRGMGAETGRDQDTSFLKMHNNPFGT